MPEIDLRGNPLMSGLPCEGQLVSLELYRLLTIFAGSPKIVELRRSDDGGCVYSWSVRSFEYPEFGRILVSLAAMLRNDWDANPGRVDANLSLLQPKSHVGILTANLTAPTGTVPLDFRESLHSQHDQPRPQSGSLHLRRPSEPARPPVRQKGGFPMEGNARDLPVGGNSAQCPLVPTCQV